MAAHRLSLEIPDTLNSCLLRVTDSSAYVDNITVKCPRLQISVPGFSNPYFIENLSTGFSLNLTACDIGIQTTKCGTEFNSLPDMVYVITYSVSPNDQVYVEYNFMRTTNAMLKLRKLYCEADYMNCVPDSQLQKLRSDIRYVHDLLLAAKCSVEDCREVSKGLKMYHEACRLLNKLNCKTGNCN